VPGQQQPHPGQHPAGQEPHRDERDDRNEGAEANAGGERPTPFTAEQLATPRADAADVRQMWIIVGPYRGSVLTMPNAEAEAAKDDHWAVEMSEVSPPYDASKPREHDHELTDEERAHAVEAAQTWADNVNAPAEEEEAPEGETEEQRNAREERRRQRNHEHNEREMRPDGTGGNYRTRSPKA
jgi:hypothetical protein